jgi:hypothetical protein
VGWKTGSRHNDVRLSEEQILDQRRGPEDEDAYDEQKDKAKRPIPHNVSVVQDDAVGSRIRPRWHRPLVVLLRELAAMELLHPLGLGE